ncbi:MAG TPA: hypothetical protein VI504_14000 [Candidatus Eisenbacteria bacterium]|jgi:hypothetical protein
MRTRIIIATAIVAAVSIAACGCARNDRASSIQSQSFAGNAMAPGVSVAPDSTPVPNPPPPRGPHQNLSLQFAGADSAAASQTANTRWLFGNSGHTSLAVSWTLTDGHHWSGFPKQGTLTLAPSSTQLLVVAVAVPDTAQAGSFNPLHMTATPQRGSIVTADGGITVLGVTPPSDSLVAGRR